jgi:oligoendopeptidase F
MTTVIVSFSACRPDVSLPVFHKVIWRQEDRLCYNPVMSTVNTATDAPPRWDMSVVYPSLESAEFAAGFAATVQQIQDTVALFEREGIAAPAEPPVVDATLVARFERILTTLTATQEAYRTLRGYIEAFVSTDSRDTLAQARSSELRREAVALGLLAVRLNAWLGALDVEALIAASPLAADHAFFLRRAKVAAEHLLPPDEEELAARLSLSGGSAWTRLYGDVTSQMSVPFARRDGDEAEDLPMSVIRALATDADRDVRRRAYEAELAAWERNAVPLAAALNAIKQETNTLTARRGWNEPLDAAVFANHINRETLDAMLTAARASFPDFRRYLRAKAKHVSGAERLPWYDLFAPVGTAGREWKWGDAEAFVAEQFGGYSPKMREFAVRAFRERWIDAEPRPGKRDGAFCMGLRADESRIAQNYRPAFNGVSTLAHELGHAYHNLCLSGRTFYQRGTPMTLAETASIFCETIIKQAAIHQGSPEEQLSILEASLQAHCQVVVDITSRFQFEQTVLTARRQRDLSIPELCEAMRQAQWDTYGDGLDEACLHPYMWAAKGHYYGATYYNYPYMFGLLFGLGLYARYQEDPDTFRAAYDDLLSRTGMADAATLAEQFGFDLRQTAFWSSSLDLIRDDIDRFVVLLENNR